MSNITKPMLAINADLENLNFVGGLWVTPKLDGIRCLIINGKAVSRNFKVIPNRKIRKTLEKYAEDGMDGELIIHDKNDKPIIFNEISGYIMSHEKELPVGYSLQYYVFDYVPKTVPLSTAYTKRCKNLKNLNCSNIIKKILPIRVNNFEELEVVYADALAEGHEGLIMRSANSP